MTFEETRALIEAIIPVAIGGSIGLLALIGIRELLRETRVALKKSASA